MESNGEVKAIMDSSLCSNSDENSKNMGLVMQIANERLAALPITNPKQMEFCRCMSNTYGDLGLKCDSISSFKKSLKINLQPRIEQEMRRLSKLNVLVIDIGSWKRITQFKGHMVAKFFFHTRRMMWEILENGVKNKIEIKWDDIVNIKVDIVTFGFCMLQVELSSSQAPLFYQEIDLKPRKHICNKISSDFTGGEAMRTRFHTLWFLEADLDKPYERLLHYEPKFATWSQTLSKPEWPYFDSNPSDIGSNVSFHSNQNMSQWINQQFDSQDHLGSVHIERGDGSQISSEKVHLVVDRDKSYERLLYIEPKFVNTPSNPQWPHFDPNPNDIGSNVSIGFDQNMSQSIDQQLDSQEHLSLVRIEQGGVGEGALVPTKGLVDIILECEAYTASNKMLDQNIQPMDSPYFQETLPRPRPEGHDQTLTHRALVEPFEQRLHVEPQSDLMIPSSDPSQEELSDLINLDYAGNDTYAEDNGSEPQNIPYYQHPLAGAEQNQENRTMGNQIFDPFESASSLPPPPPPPPPPSSPPLPPPVQYQSATTNNDGPREASTAALSIHQEMGNYAEATIQLEPTEGMGIVKRLCIDSAAILEQNQNMASESLIHNPNFTPHDSFER